MYTNRFKLSALPRAQTYVSVQKHRAIYNRIYDTAYVYLWVFACIHRTSKCEHLQGRKHMGSDTKLPMIQHMYTNIREMYVYKKVLNVRTRKAQTYVSLHNIGFIYKRIDDRKYVHF